MGENVIALKKMMQSLTKPFIKRLYPKDNPDNGLANALSKRHCLKDNPNNGSVLLKCNIGGHCFTHNILFIF